jgi:hypothetical protein
MGTKIKLPQIKVDWKENSVSMFAMDGTILANSKDSGKGKVFEEIARRVNAYQNLVEALRYYINMPQMAEANARCVLRELGEES